MKNVIYASFYDGRKRRPSGIFQFECSRDRSCFVASLFLFVAIINDSSWILMRKSDSNSPRTFVGSSHWRTRLKFRTILHLWSTLININVILWTCPQKSAPPAVFASVKIFCVLLWTPATQHTHTFRKHHAVLVFRRAAGTTGASRESKTRSAAANNLPHPTTTHCHE